MFASGTSAADHHPRITVESRQYARVSTESAKQRPARQIPWLDVLESLDSSTRTETLRPRHSLRAATVEQVDHRPSRPTRQWSAASLGVGPGGVRIEGPDASDTASR